MKIAISVSKYTPKRINRNMFLKISSREITHSKQGRQTGGGVGGSQPPLNFVWGGGVEHLSTPPDFEKIFIMGGGGGWLPLN